METRRAAYQGFPSSRVRGLYGGWSATMGQGARRRAAIRQGCDRLYLVDGEKDVETLEAHGQVATAPPMGTMMTWRGEWVAYFYGAKFVRIIADNDANGTGLRDAWKIAKSFQVAGILHDVASVPEGKDVTDFFA